MNDDHDEDQRIEKILTVVFDTIFTIGVIGVIGIICLFLFYSGCSQRLPVHNAGCLAATERLEALECHDLLMIPGVDETPGTTDDISYLIYCEAVQRSKIVEIDTQCIIASTNCLDAEVCSD